MSAIALLRGVFNHLKMARRTKAEVREFNLVRFREMVAFVKQRSPYYAAIIEEHKIDISSCTPEDFPIMTKEDLMDNFDTIVTDPRVTKDAISYFLVSSKDPTERFLGDYYVVHTSGSSGQIGYFVYTVAEWAYGFSLSMRIHRLGIRTRYAYVAATRGHFAGITLISFGKSGANQLFYRGEAFDINDPMREIIAGLNEFQPQILSGYATALRRLAEAKNQGTLKITPRLVENGGEPLFSKERQFLLDAFGCPVINIYASSEHLLMGIGKEEWDGMYLMEDDLIYEIRPDFICVTNLFNRTMPLIRYRMDDVLELQEDKVGAYPFTQVRDIVGRMEYTPIFENAKGEEDFIHALVFVEFFVKNLARFQIQLESRVAFTFKAQLVTGLDPEDRTEVIFGIQYQLKAILAQKGLDNVTFVIEKVTELYVDTRTGKFKLILPPPEVDVGDDLRSKEEDAGAGSNSQE